MKKRTPHSLMKEAILEYVQREETRQNFIKAANTSFEHYPWRALTAKQLTDACEGLNDIIALVNK